MKKIYLCLFILFACSPSIKKNVIDESNNELKSKNYHNQKDIVGKLTGKTPIKNDYTLKSRYHENEKIMVRTYLKELISSLSLEAKEHKYIVPNKDSTALKKTFEGINIYTTLPATTNNDEYIILGAHYDSVENCPGANDNATGVAMIYSIISKLNSMKFRTKNIILVFFDEEEKGLIGSTAFAKMIKEKNIKIHSVHTVDQMGWDKDGDRAIELELPTQYLEAKYKEFAKQYKIPIHISDIDYTDHKSFRLLGYNAIGITEEYKNKDSTPHYHKSSDTYDTVDFEYLLSTTKLATSVFESIVSEN